MRELIPGLTLDIDTDRLAARLAIVANVEAVDSPTIIAALEGEGITRTQIDEEAIAVALAAARAGPHDAEPTEAVVARGTPVHHGRNARVDIEPDLAEQLDRPRAVLSKTAGAAERAKVCDEADVSHYEVNALCVVAPGQRIGRELDAEPGEDGLDIFGKVIGAREGRDIALKLDGAARDGAGVITAKHAGLLLIDPTQVTVSKELRPPGAGAATTGHGRFPGDAGIADGVRDNFRVEVGGTLTVRNRVEAATLKSGVDVILERGMAGRNKGRIDAGRDLAARYLDSVTGTVGRDLIVENEITGCDIAVDAIHHAKSTDLSMRRGYYFVPKYVFGKPADTLGRTTSLPMWLRRKIDGVVLNWFAGNPQRYGFPKPDYKLYESHPVVNSLILFHAGHGDLKIRPDIDRLDGNTVHFADGSAADYDMIVTATGYVLDYPFISKDLLNWTGAAPSLYLNCMHPQRDDLFVLGMVEATGLGWQGRHEQAELVARYIAGLQTGNREADNIKRYKANGFQRATGGVNYLKLARMAYYVDKKTYRKSVTQRIAALKEAAR